MSILTLSKAIKKKPTEKIRVRPSNVLHIAIVKKRLDLVKKLMSKEPMKLLKSMCVGNFFKEGKACYYGESPLAFALTTSQFDMFDILLEAGADINVEDSNGNNMLHLCVIHNLQPAFEYFKRVWIEIHGKQEDRYEKGVCNDRIIV